MSNQTCKKALAHQSNLLTLVHNSVRRSSNNEILQEIYPKKQEPIKDNLTTEPTQLIAEEISQGTPQDVYLNSMNHPLSKQLQNLTTSVKHVSVEKLKQVLLENEMCKQRIKDLENKCKSLEGRYHEKVNNGTLKGIVDNLEMTLKQDECEIPHALPSLGRFQRYVEEQGQSRLRLKEEIESLENNKAGNVNTNLIAKCKESIRDLSNSYGNLGNHIKIELASPQYQHLDEDLTVSSNKMRELKEEHKRIQRMFEDAIKKLEKGETDLQSKQKEKDKLICLNMKCENECRAVQDDYMNIEKIGNTIKTIKDSLVVYGDLKNDIYKMKDKLKRVEEGKEELEEKVRTAQLQYGLMKAKISVVLDAIYESIRKSKMYQYLASFHKLSKEREEIHSEYKTLTQMVSNNTY